MVIAEPQILKANKQSSLISAGEDSSSLLHPENAMQLSSILNDSATIKEDIVDVQNYEGVNNLAVHGRNFSVNLPYASKPTLHTNMGSLMVSRKTSRVTASGSS